MTSKKKTVAIICGSVCFLVLASIVAIISFIGLGFGLMAIDNKIEARYYNSANWNCESDEEFLSEYKPLYEEKIDSLVKDEFGFEKLVETNEKIGEFNVYYYNDTTTICFEFCQAPGFAFFKAYCYCYEANGMNLQDYEEQKQYVDFFNEVINFCAFDARGDKNTFENLFDKALVDGGYDSYFYHFDNFCGNVGYSVVVNSNFKSYYYKMGKNSELDICSNRFLFEGILKPQF